MKTIVTTEWKLDFLKEDIQENVSLLIFPTVQFCNFVRGKCDCRIFFKPWFFFYIFFLKEKKIKALKIESGLLLPILQPSNMKVLPFPSQASSIYTLPQACCWKTNPSESNYTVTVTPSNSSKILHNIAKEHETLLTTLYSNSSCKYLQFSLSDEH